ncbi:hypothetical protein L9F63_023073, partial [Diploptera punctata]
ISPLLLHQTYSSISSSLSKLMQAFTADVSPSTAEGIFSGKYQMFPLLDYSNVAARSGTPRRPISNPNAHDRSQRKFYHFLLSGTLTFLLDDDRTKVKNNM